MNRENRRKLKIDSINKQIHNLSDDERDLTKDFVSSMVSDLLDGKKVDITKKIEEFKLQDKLDNICNNSNREEDMPIMPINCSRPDFPLYIDEDVELDILHNCVDILNKLLYKAGYSYNGYFCNGSRAPIIRYSSGMFSKLYTLYDGYGEKLFEFNDMKDFEKKVSKKIEIFEKFC